MSKTNSQKFADLKAHRGAEGLMRKFYWLTDGDAKQFAEDYKKSESYRIIQELKQKKVNHENHRRKNSKK